jgi:hypothetical protein
MEISKINGIPLKFNGISVDLITKFRSLPSSRKLISGHQLEKK